MSLDEFYREHHRRLFRYAYRHVRHEELAADLVHEALSRALPRLVPTDGRPAVAADRWAAYLFRTVHNLAVNALTRRREDATDPAELPPMGSADVADRVTEAGEVRRCLAALSLHERSAYLLSIEGFAQREIGEMIGLSPDAVFRRIRSAEGKLRACLEGTAEHA
jgi:RNA polymerase sigma factor (sigma-70 family)